VGTTTVAKRSDKWAVPRTKTGLEERDLRRHQRHCELAALLISLFSLESRSHARSPDYGPSAVHSERVCCAYSARLRRRWIKTKSVIAKPAPAIRRISVTLSIVTSFYLAWML
jgi:hypothetical protein